MNATAPSRLSSLQRDLLDAFSARDGPTARLPGEVAPAELDSFREALVLRLRELAFRRARHE